MKLSKWSVNITLVGVLAVSSVSAFATNQQCGLLQNCASKAQTPTSENKGTKPVDTLTYYLENLALTPDQIVMLRKVQESQVPLIMLSKRNLEQAHAKLREMAMRNINNQELADQLAQVIANHTANLAVLQAQREYEIFSMLSDEQVARYENLVAQEP